MCLLLTFPCADHDLHSRLFPLGQLLLQKRWQQQEAISLTAVS